VDNESAKEDVEKSKTPVNEDDDTSEVWKEFVFKYFFIILSMN
jgi:hypothetical protein